VFIIIGFLKYLESSSANEDFPEAVQPLMQINWFINQSYQFFLNWTVGLTSFYILDWF